jgi:hypothetical protein
MDTMTTRWTTWLALGLILTGCSSSSEGIGTVDPGKDGGVSGHALSLTGNLVARSGELSFLTPTVALVKVPVANVVGKPYLVSSFPAGFSPGNDPPIHYVWGSVPADLQIRYTTPSTYQNGAYDMVLVVYTNTPISEEIKKASPHLAPAAKGGDLASFTLDMSAVRPGDPALPPGLVRLNVENADGAVTIENKIVDPDQPDIPAALANTIMLVP